MNKFSLLFIFFVSLVVEIKAQSKIDAYQSTYFKKTFDINVSQNPKDTSEYSYYIDCASADKLHQQVCLDIESKNLPDFIEFLTSIKNTYIKWNQTAKANNVTELDKDIEVKHFGCASAFVYGKWNFDFHTLLSPRVKIIEGNMVLIISSGELQSSSNEFMKHDGYNIVFSTPDEVNDFIKKLDINKAKSFFYKKNHTSDLFKN